MTGDRARARGVWAAAALGVVLAVAAAGCAGGARPEVLPPTTSGPDPDTMTVDTAYPPDGPIDAADDVCDALSSAVLALFDAGPARSEGGETPKCSARTADGGTVSVERRVHPKGTAGAIPDYHAGRRNVPLYPVGEASLPMLWAEPDGFAELAVFTTDAAFVFRFPDGTEPGDVLLDAVGRAVTGG